MASFGPYAALVEWRDPSLGPDIAAEAGSGYGTHAATALLAVIAEEHLGVHDVLEAYQRG